MKELERARWRCRRGMLELDIVLLRFMDKHYAQLNEVELQQFEELLSLPDNELWDLIVGKKRTITTRLSTCYICYSLVRKDSQKNFSIRKMIFLPKDGF